MIPADKVDAAIEEMQKSHANYEYFFEKASSPAWIAPLHARGYFCVPPPPIEFEGFVQYPSWAESRFLVRMARQPDAQADIAQIVLSLPDTANIRVTEDIAEIALACEPRTSAKLVEKAVRGLKSMHHLGLPRKLARLVAHLLSGNQVDEAFCLAEMLLNVDAELHARDDGTAARKLTDVQSGLGSWEYEEVLRLIVPELQASDDSRSIALLSRTLYDACPQPVKVDASEFHDASYYWRPAVEEHSQNHGRGIRDALVSSLRSAAEYSCEKNPGRAQITIEDLESHKPAIFQRIALHLCTKYYSHVPALVDARILRREYYELPDVRHEFYHLLRNTFGRLDSSKQREVLRIIDTGPPERASNAGHPTEPDEDTARAKDLWRRQWLSAVADALEGDWKSIYEELVRKYGVPSHPDFLIYSSSWVGPTSPLPQEKLKAMNVDDVLHYLETWQPPRDEFSASIEGLCRELKSLVVEKAEQFAENACRFSKLDPTYVRTLFDGLEDATKNGKQIDIDGLLSLGKWVVIQPIVERDVKAVTLDRDPSWSWTRGSILRFLKGILSVNVEWTPFHHRTTIWTILEVLAEDADPPSERDGADYGSPYSVCINSIRGQAIETVMQYALWVRRHIASSPAPEHTASSGFDDMPEVRAVLDKHLDPTQDPSLAIRSAYGYWFPWLVLLDPTWAKSAKDTIFEHGDQWSALGKAAWDAYIMYARPYDNVVPLLLAEYNLAVKNLSIKQSAQSSSVADLGQRLADHLLELHTRGRITFESTDGLLVHFERNASASLVAYSITTVGHGLQEVPEALTVDVATRLQALWERWSAVARKLPPEDGRAVLTGFGWWFASGKLDSSWSLSQFRSTLEMVFDPQPDFLIAERLSALVRNNASVVLDVLECMIQGGKGHLRIVGWREHAIAILSGALQSVDPGAREHAIRLANLLGSMGFSDFRSLVSSKDDHPGNRA